MLLPKTKNTNLFYQGLFPTTEDTAMNFQLSEEQEAFRQQVRDFSEKEIKPIADKIDKEEFFDPKLYKKMAKIGLMGLTVPKKYGGAGVDRVSYMNALIEVGRVCGSTAIILEAHNSLGVGHIYERGTEEQRKKYLPKLCDGSGMGAWALTEPNSGSDSAAMQTTAELDGNEWVLNGTKQFITNAKTATVLTIMAKTDKTKGAKGISAFIVPKDTKGLGIGQIEDKLGLRGSNTCELIIEDLRIPKENLLGEKDLGFLGAMNILDRGRVAIAAMALGIAQGAFEESIRFAKNREQFGKPISKTQSIQWKIADMATEIEAAKLLVYQGATLEDQGVRFTKEASMAKLYTTTIATKATRAAIDIHGGYGVLTSLPVERYYRDIKLCEIGEGTSEIQRLVIARQLGL